MRKVALHNLGCKVNSYELDVIGQKLEEKGYKIVPFDEKADIYVINTCTVTNMADRKSRQMLHQAKKRNPEAIVVAVWSMCCRMQGLTLLSVITKRRTLLKFWRHIWKIEKVRAILTKQ